MKQQATWLTVIAILSFTLGLVVATFSSISEFVPELLQGAWVTIQITAGGAVVAVVAALLGAMGKLYGPGPIRWLCIAYIETFRGTSALIQLFWLFYVLPYFGVLLEPMAVGIFALGLNVGAYGAEVIRGSISAVPKGQWEASVALNMTRIQTLFRVILPQAFVTMIPPWGNLFIELLKSTALVSLITLSDLAFKAQQLNQNTLRTVEIFSIVLLAYLAISLLITLAMKALERRATLGLGRGRVN